MHVMDLESGAVEDIPINQLVYPNIVFLPDERSFVYQRHDNRFHADIGLRYKNVRMRLHQFGTLPGNDPVVADVNEPAEPKFAESDRFRAIRFLRNSNKAVMTVRNGMSSPLRVYSKSLDQLPDIKVPWQQKLGEEVKIRWTDADSQYFYILYDKENGQSAVDRIDFTQREPLRKTVFETKSGSIATFRVSRDGLYILKRDGLMTSLLKISNGNATLEIKARNGEVFDGLSSAIEQDGVVVRTVSFSQPESFQYWSGGRNLLNLNIPGWGGETEGTSDIEVRVEYAEAKDKTRIPIWLVKDKKSPLHASTPIMIDAYGSYADITKPEYNVNRNEIYKRGGAIAYCMVRGGGELGPAWHEAGKRANKMNTVQDTVACAEHLIQKGWTSSEKLALFNSSAGGLIASYVVSHEPGLFRAVITQAAILNVSDLTRMPIGFVNKSEFGDPAIKEENEVLEKLDGFKTLQRPDTYPALLALHGFNDPRVPVWFSTRYVHRLRQLQKAPRPALFYGDFESGHGLFATAKQKSERWARIITFLDQQLGFPKTIQGSGSHQ
jgi:prolyl oligopeptidase